MVTSRKKIASFTVVHTLIRVFLMITTVYPFWSTIGASLSAVNKVGGLQRLPNQFTLDACERILDYD